MRRTKLLIALFCFFTFLAISALLYFYPFSAGDCYDSQLSFLKKRCHVQNENIPGFFLFGMGNREKMIYKDYELKVVESRQVVRSWASGAVYDEIIPDEYAVRIVMQDGEIVRISEDEKGVWIQSGKGEPVLVGDTSSPIRLPEFKGFLYGKILKVLHHEMLINIQNGAIYPNIFVYRQPWYRDGAMVAMCLERTGNLGLIRTWVLSIRKHYDMQNRMEELDNLGQLLYLLSLFPEEVDQSFHRGLVEEIESVSIDTGGGYMLAGLSDFSPNAQYQTDFLRYAVTRSKGVTLPIAKHIDDPGSYKDLAWFSPGWKGKRNRMGIRDSIALFLGKRHFSYPYLDWARAHFYRDWQVPMLSSRYPLSWESHASEANYEGMSIIDEGLVRKRIAYPHAWAAAEMFLYLYEFHEEPVDGSSGGAGEESQAVNK